MLGFLRTTLHGHTARGFVVVAAIMLVSVMSLPCTNLVCAEPTPKVSALESTGAPATPKFADFRPSKHGFRFVNSFKGSPVAFAGIEIGPASESSYGLCGGMSFAAADLYISGKGVPSQSTPPTRGSPLFEALVRRQTDSLGPGMREALRFSQWMARPDDGPAGTRELTLGSVPAIIDTLDAGKPVVLGLVLTRRGKGNALWENHQVLAYRSSRDHTDTLLHIYDPNYPGADDAVIRCRAAIVGEELDVLTGLHVPLMGLVCTREVPSKRTTNVRGVFAMHYEFASPERIAGE
jgi:hypothetical protein